jgi:4'-phosphopantetheinyl transferase EntD
MVGAITHTTGYASVAVARAQRALGIGLDAERWIAEDEAERVADSIAERGEIAAVARATGWPFARALTLVFSAKESVFKCFFPEVGRYFDFKDAAIRAVDVARREFAGELLVTLTPRLTSGYAFGGHYDADELLLVTGVLAEPT